MAYTVMYHHLVKSEDLPKLDGATKIRIRKAIETRLITAPEEYGEPLRRTLKGYWKLGVGDYRVVFKVEGDEITIPGIHHRLDIYKIMTESRDEGLFRALKGDRARRSGGFRKKQHTFFLCGATIERGSGPIPRRP